VRPGSGRGRRARGALLVAGSLVLAACAGGGGSASSSATSPAGSSAASGSTSSAPQAITLYTCISDQYVQPVIQGFQAAHPGDTVQLFRAPTGQLNARVASDVRSGGLRADVVWACDPLTQQAFVDQGLVGGWTPPDASGVPAKYRTPNYVGAALLYVVAVRHSGVPAPAAWKDLTGSAYSGGVAVPDPAVAASALGALGWFSAQPGYGTGFYRALKANGAVQVSTPDDVTTGVAQGRFRAGITIASSAYPAKAAGSPIDVTWPQPGAIAVYEPVAVAKNTAHRRAAQDFVGYLVGREAQTALGKAGSYPALAGVSGPTMPAHAPIVEPDWAAIGKSTDTLLTGYQQVFGG
jgi:iron(III) transport system substrate-binding protein